MTREEQKKENELYKDYVRPLTHKKKNKQTGDYDEVVNDYMDVTGRVLIFWNERVKDTEASIVTDDISSKDTVVQVKARVTITRAGCVQMATGYASETIGDSDINRTNALENCETSAVGRALGFLGIGLLSKGGIASADEMTDALRRQGSQPMDDGKGEAPEASRTRIAPTCHYCGCVMEERKSGSKANPGRMFYGCINEICQKTKDPEGMEHGMFRVWVDEAST